MHNNDFVQLWCVRVPPIRSCTYEQTTSSPAARLIPSYDPQLHLPLVAGLSSDISSLTTGKDVAS